MELIKTLPGAVKNEIQVHQQTSSSGDFINRV